MMHPNSLYECFNVGVHGNGFHTGSAQTKCLFCELKCTILGKV